MDTGATQTTSMTGSASNKVWPPTLLPSRSCTNASGLMSLNQIHLQEGDRELCFSCPVSALQEGHKRRRTEWMWISNPL